MNPYKILGIKKNATADAISRAYKNKAKKYHPDNQSTGNAEKFLAIKEARDCLMDSEKRRHFDETGEMPNSEAAEVRRKAAAWIADIFQSTVFNNDLGTLKTTNIIAEMMKFVAKHKQECQQKITKLQDRKKNIDAYKEAVKSRLKKKSTEGNCIFNQALMSMDQRIAQALYAEEVNMRFALAAEAILDDYSFAPDHQRTVWVTTTTASGW